MGKITDLTIETERLILLPFKNKDYINWYKQFDNRLPSQYKYDDGRPLDMPSSTEEWFIEWINGFNELARNDDIYISLEYSGKRMEKKLGK